MSERAFEVLLTGDFHYGESYNRAGARVLAQYGYDHSTAYLLPFIERADITIFNLETPIVNPDEVPSPLRGKKRYIHWAHPAGTTAALKRLGVDAVSLANNHAVDHGPDGLLATFDHLENARIPWFGAGRTLEEARSPYVIRVPESHGGGEIHLHGSFQYSRRHDEEYSFYASPTAPGCAPISRSVSTNTEVGADADVLSIAFPHWGANYKWRTPGQQKIANRLLSDGVDLVLGHGSHCVQEIERASDHWIVYSLGNGNFQSGGRFKQYGEEHGILPIGLWAMLRLEIIDDTDRQVKLRLYPVHIDNKQTNYQPRPIGVTDMPAVFSAILSPDSRRSYPGGATMEKDNLGPYIELDVANWPIGATPSPTSIVDVRDPYVEGLGDERVYADDETTNILRHYEAGKNLGALLNVRAAEKAGASIEWISQNSAVATRGDRQLLINGYKCDESDLGARIVQDKSLIKDFLAANGVRTPLGRLAESSADAVRIAAEFDRPVVVKPRSGNKGRGITVNISGADDVVRAFERADAVGGGVLVEEYVPATAEYRCLATDRECVSVVKRILPNVTGDGRSSIQALIRQKNRRRAMNPALYNRYIPVDDIVQSCLAKVGYSLETVLPAGECVTVRDVGGLSSGGEPHECSEQVAEGVKQTAAAAVRAIPGLTWGGADLIVARDSGLPYIIEINSDADIGGATFPLEGPPQDVASRMWALKLGSSSAASKGAPELPLMRRRSGSIESGFNGEFFEFATLAELYFGHLASIGVGVDRLGKSVVRLSFPDGSVEYVTSEAMTAKDLSSVRRVVRRHGDVRRLLRRASIPRVLGKRITSHEQAMEFALSLERPVTVLPYRSEWNGPRVMTLEYSKGANRIRFDRFRSWFIQSEPLGPRFTVFATPSESLAVLGHSTSEVGRSEVMSAADISVSAVRAVPQLRWAAVDVVISGGRRRRALVRGMCVNPRIDSQWHLFAGSLEKVFEAIRAAP